jgi:lincosamide nucleotidyltransferase A/C/D/E
VELTAPGRGWVDLHPVVFDSSGHGRQADRNGGHFDYPSDAFDDGIIDGIATPCLSGTPQVRFHRGYEPRSVDIHDLGLLEQISQ